jgi:hypothetical protein
LIRSSRTTACCQQASTRKAAANPDSEKQDVRSIHLLVVSGAEHPHYELRPIFADTVVLEPTGATLRP